MIGKKLLAFTLCAHLFNLFVQGQVQQGMKLDATSIDNIVTRVMMSFFQLDELRKPYCEKYSNCLPIWCGNCKGRKLSVCDFPVYLSAMILTNASDKKEANKKEVEKIALIFDNFLKILTVADPQESTMVDFVLQEVKNVDFLCPHCHLTAWEKIPEEKI
jgi:hypothetical protein